MKNILKDVFSKLLLNFMIWICIDFVFEILVDDRFGIVRNTTLTNSTNFISQFSPYHWYETNGLSKISFCPMDAKYVRETLTKIIKQMESFLIRQTWP